MRLKIILALVVIAATIGTSGCKPKEITGQVFIASSGGMSFRLGAVEVQLIEKQQVVDFLKRKQTSIEAEVKLRKDALAAAQEKVTEIQSEVEQAQFRYDLFLINEPWLTNAVYLNLDKEQKRLQGLEAQFEKTSNAARTAGDQSNLRSQLVLYHNAAIRIEDQKTQVKNAMTGIEYKKLDEVKWRLYEPQLAAETARKELDGHLKLETYLSDFDLPAVSKANTDAEGNFALPCPRNGKFSIFARASRTASSETEKYMWLIDAPNDARFGRVLLNNNNLVESDPDGYFKLHEKSE